MSSEVALQFKEEIFKTYATKIESANRCVCVCVCVCACVWFLQHFYLSWSCAPGLKTHLSVLVRWVNVASRIAFVMCYVNDEQNPVQESDQDFCDLGRSRN